MFTGLLTRNIQQTDTDLQYEASEQPCDATCCELHGERGDTRHFSDAVQSAFQCQLDFDLRKPSINFNYSTQPACAWEPKQPWNGTQGNLNGNKMRRLTEEKASNAHFIPLRNRGGDMPVFLISHLQELNGAVRDDSSRHNGFTAGRRTLKCSRHGNKEHIIM